MYTMIPNNIGLQIPGVARGLTNRFWTMNSKDCVAVQLRKHSRLASALLWWCLFLIPNILQNPLAMVRGNLKMYLSL